MTEWAAPEFFGLLLPLALVLAWAVYWRHQRRPSLQFSQIDAFKATGRSVRSYLSSLPFLLKTLAVLAMIAALAQPQRSDTQVQRNVEGIDIMIALDVSDSMLIEDMRPENRLEASKQVIQKFIVGRTSDRIGLVIFSGESYTRVPLTLDYSLLSERLSTVETSQNLKMGTAIGVALANAVARLKDSTAKSRVVVLLTDGENNSGTIAPETALDIAKGYGVRIYSIGMGKDGQAQLPVYLQGPGGQKIKRYRPIHSKVNEPLLSKMAEETGGRFWRTTTTPSLQEVFDEIDRLERTKIEVNEYTQYTELFQIPLRWAILFLLSALVLERSILRRGP